MTNVIKFKESGIKRLCGARLWAQWSPEGGYLLWEYMGQGWQGHVKVYVFQPYKRAGSPFYADANYLTINGSSGKFKPFLIDSDTYLEYV